jgi:hypothetical protein
LANKATLLAENGGIPHLSLLKNLVMEPYLEAEERAKESFRGMWSLCDK